MAEITKWNEDDKPEWFDRIDIVMLEKMAASGYQPKQIAMFFEIPSIEFLYYFNLPDSPLQYHYKRGILGQQVMEGFSMSKDAISGINNSQALRFDRLRDQNKLSSSIDQIFFPDIE